MVSGEDSSGTYFLMVLGEPRSGSCINTNRAGSVCTGPLSLVPSRVVPSRSTRQSFLTMAYEKEMPPKSPPFNPKSGV